MNAEIITSPKVAEILGIHYQSLRRIISDYPELKPATKVGNAFLWTEEEIEAIRQKRVELRSRKPKPNAQ